jgi:Domain of unknown function (DUF1772)
MDAIEAIVLWLFVVFLGVAFGASIYESRIEIPRWRNLPPNEWTDTGRTFWAFVTTGPVTLLTLASIAIVWQVDGTARDWWIGAIAIAVVERAATFGFFIPTMVRLQSGGVDAVSARTLLDRWATANIGRHLLNLAAWLCAIQALRLLD